MTSMVYKFCYMNSNKIKKVTVCIGGRFIENKNIDINALYKSEPNNKLFSDIFSAEEKMEITSSDIDFLPMEIHLDDTIETIKKKYILASKNNPTYSGLYFYIKTRVPLTPTKVYEHLTQSGQITLTKERLAQYLINIDDLDILQLPEKEIYSYEDVLELNLLSRETWNVSIPLGHTFHGHAVSYNFTANPFIVSNYDSELLRSSNDTLATTNQYLLMDNPDIYNHTIYVCHVEDVMSYTSTLGLSQEQTVLLYFPYLRESDIYSLSDYEKNKESLNTDTSALIQDDSWLQNGEHIDMFYNMSNSYNGDRLILHEGIKHAVIIMEPEFNYNLPLDVVFKLIHATSTVPFIKYNPSGRREKIYRLFTDKVTVTGRKIPSLPKGTIFKLMKNIAKNKEVALYIETGNEPIVLSFFENGRIEAMIDFSKAMTIDEINILLKTTCNPIIETVSEYLQQRGYSMKLFHDIRDKDVRVTNITYVIKSNISKKINFKSIIKCVSSVFNVIEDDITKGAVLRFKKVTNYNEMDSMEAFIVESLNTGDRDVDIIKGLMNNFRINNETEAKQILVDFVSRQQVVQQAFRNKRYKIKNNPGFLTLIEREKFETNINTTISGIDNIGYLDTIPHYIKGLLIVTQTPTLSSVPISRIKTLCTGGKVVEEKKKEDLISTIEEPPQIQSVMFKTKQDDPDTTMQKGMLDMLLDDDDDDDSGDDSGDSDDNDDDDDEALEMEGGADSPEEEEEIYKDITGLSLSNPNPFSQRLIEREPNLFLTNAGPGFSSYSRSCPSSNRRQPVILTQEEKDKIDNEHPGSYEHALSYKSSPDTPTYHYICPRYWSISEGVSLTQEEVDSGKYKAVIPKDSKEVPSGTGVYEFDSEYHRNAKGEYVGTQPGFMKPSKHPDGLCVPCCFKGWDTPSQTKLRETCQGQQKEKVEETTTKKKKKLKLVTTHVAAEKFDEYVKGPEKFPLESGRIGYLPVTIQRFLNIDNRDCQISSQNTNIKKNKPCLVRIGVEKNNKQSFIAAIANIYADNLPQGKSIPTITEMKQIILNALTIDIFISLQNGSLIETFDDRSGVNISLYVNTSIYKKLNHSDPSQLQLLNKIIRSYENFRNYISNPEVTIGYEYLWDLICFRNEKLFDKGLNLVILESKEDDITGNVGLICPTNHYSNSYFDVNKKVAILIKKDQLYEPIILYEDKEKQYVITRRFSLKYRALLPSLKDFLDMIKQSLDKCYPLSSMPMKYKFKTNISLEEMLTILKVKKYTIKRQLLNYNGKVIGLDLYKGVHSGMVPVYPSPTTNDTIPHEWIDTYDGDNYEDTLAFLNYVHSDTKGRVPSFPVIKVIDQDLIVGIITQTNQFVPINPPTQDTYGDDLEIIRDIDYVRSDKTSLTENKIDDNRIKYMNRIKLESGFFNTFRNLIRMLLGQYKFQPIRNTIETIVKDESMTYKNKLRYIHDQLITLSNDYISFTTFDSGLIDDMTHVTNCYSQSKDKCIEHPYCLTKQDTCILMIPKINLINNIDNEEMYYGRLSDEILRYSRIRSFIFEPKSFLSFSDVKYNLRDNEVILLQSLLTPEYFDNLIPRLENKHVTHNSYETAQPIITQPYSNIVSMDTQTRIVCESPTIKSVTGKWINVFPKNINELIFSNVSPVCSFDILITILQDFLGEEQSLTLEQIKETLSEVYTSMYDEYSNAIYAAFRIQGKSNMAQKLKIDALDITALIMNDTYFITPLDIWIIVRHFNIPLILYSNSIFQENNKNIILCNTTDSKEYYFIKVSNIKQGLVPTYSLLVFNGKSLIGTSYISDNVRSEINVQQQLSDDLLIHFLDNVPRIKKKKLKIV